MKTIYLASGCFWGVEKYLSLIQGVVSTAVGYANGRTESPTYELPPIFSLRLRRTVRMNRHSATHILTSLSTVYTWM